MPRAGYDAVYLVTGFPSLYGQRVVREILAREPKSLVHAVVLPKFALRAEEAKVALDTQQRARLVLVEGDASAMDLGLSGAELRERAAEVDRIHHMAFASYAGLARKRAELTNVVGTGEILEVARFCRHLRLLAFHSTVLVTGSRAGVVADGALGRDALGEAPSDLAPVLATRFAAEKHVRRALGELPIAILRSGQVVGDTETGEVERLDGPYLLALVALVAPPEIRAALALDALHVHMTPIDYVSRAAQVLGAREESAGKTFHLVTPEPVTARAFFDAVGEVARAHASARLPPYLVTALLRAPGIEGFARSPRRFLEEHLSRTRYEDAATREALGESGVSCPPLAAFAERLTLAVIASVKGAPGEHGLAEPEPEPEPEEPDEAIV